MDTPRITVIVPTYNRAGFLGAAIESVLGQTRGDLELLVVDDGSDDDTAEVARGFPDPRLRYLPRPHTGIGASLNAGLRAARGAYVGRVDSDDVWLPRMLEATAGALDRDPAAGVAYGRGEAMDRCGRPLPAFLSARRGRAEPLPGETLRGLLRGDFTCNIAMLARRECFDRAGPYDETLPAAEDWDMWIRVAFHHRFVFVDEVLARYRLHAGNVTNWSARRGAAAAGCRIRVLDKTFARDDLPPPARADRAACYRDAYAVACHRLLLAGDVGAARDAFRKAVEIGGAAPAALRRIADEVAGPAAIAQAIAGLYYRR